MTVSPTDKRVITVVAVVAVVLAALLLGDIGGGDETPGTAPDPSPTLAPTSPPPSSVSAEDFCVVFRAMAAAHANHLANDTEASAAELRAATEQLLWLAPGTPMGPQARQGLEEMVAGVLEEAAGAPDQTAADALTAYLEVACRPTGL